MDPRKTGHNGTRCVGDHMDGELIRDSGKHSNVKEVYHNKIRGTRRRHKDDFDSIPYIDDDSDRDGDTFRDIDNGKDGDKYENSDRDSGTCRDIDNGKDVNKYENSDRDSGTCRDIDNGKDKYKNSDRDNGKDTSSDDSSGSDTDTDSDNSSSDSGDSDDELVNGDVDGYSKQSSIDGDAEAVELRRKASRKEQHPEDVYDCSCQDEDKKSARGSYSSRGATGDVSDCQSVGSDFKVTCYKRQTSELLTSATDADGDKVIDPYGNSICFHRPKDSDDQADAENAEATAKADVISINSDSDDENELVESKKGQLHICRNSTFCRIDSRVSKHRGQKHIRHYIIKEDNCTDIIGETGLKPLDELLRVNGRKLKDLKQKKVRRIFRKIKLNKRTNDVNITLHIRRWLSSSETGPLHERKWIQVKEITLELVLEPVCETSQERGDPRNTVSRWRKLESAVSFSVRTSNSTVRNDKNLNRGCIDIERINGVKKNKIRCNSQGLFVSNVALANALVGLSVITDRVNCEFYAEFFSGLDTSPKSAFTNYLFCVRLRVRRPSGFAFLSSDISRGNTNAIFIAGKDDFYNLKRQQAVDERCFVIRSIGSSDLFQSLIYRDRFMSYDEESGHIYWKQISKKLQDAFVAGQEKSGPRTPVYQEAVNALSTCWFTRGDPDRGFHKRIGKALRSYLCGIKQ